MSDMPDDLARVALIFQKNNVRFVLIGARAAAFHGHIRATEDIDLLIEDSVSNITNAIRAIQELYPQLEETLSPTDFYEAVVVKILDEPELDISISAWDVKYSDTLEDHNHCQLEGVDIPYLGLDSLIRTKLTEREQDKWDVQVLREIQRQHSQEK